MTMRIIRWSPEQQKQTLASRLQSARAARRIREDEWRQVEDAIYSIAFPDASYTTSGSANGETSIEDLMTATTWVETNYIFKNFRIIHSQMAANPPAVAARALSSDSEDRRRARAADHLIRYAGKQYNMQDTFDRGNLYMLVYGTGVLKGIWNPDTGDILDVDDATDEITLEGDYDLDVVSPWRFYPDPDASTWRKVQWCFEEVELAWETALSMFGMESEELLKKFRVTASSDSSDSKFKKPKYDIVRLYQYWETGLPQNGMRGRFCWCTEDGDSLTKMTDSPHRFEVPVEEGEPQRPPVASLPYHMLTDVDIPDTYWGRAVTAYEIPLQDIMNRLDSVTLDNLKLHSVFRLILPEGAEVADSSISNSPHEIIKMTGSQPPHYMQPGQLPREHMQLRAQAKQGVDDMAGVNESMSGQQSRETATSAMQYSVNQGNMVRLRVFNKYVMLVESVYRQFLDIVRTHWDTPRTVRVLGKEKAFQAMDIQGADVRGGFDLVIEYGTTFSLDPVSRRQEMLTYLPIFKEAGVPGKTLLSLLKLGELDLAYDIAELGEDRQREAFEEIIATGEYVAPEKWEDHASMLEYARIYTMTAEFKYLKPEQKQLIVRHIEERASLVAAAPPPVGGMPPPVPGAPPVLN